VQRHSELGASAAARWMNCPGSVRMVRGVPQQDSRYAAEGMLAHTVAQQCLTRDCNAGAFLGFRSEDGLQVTPEMVRGVQLYVDVCRHKMDACDLHWVEQPFTLARCDPPTDMFGTTDFAALSRRRRELHIVDLKYGRGTWVPAKNSPQLRYYALGAACTIDEPVSRVSMTVVQPRFSNADPIRTWSIDAVELAEFSFELMARARAALEPDAPTIAGEWCKFCPAKNSCLAFQNVKSSATYHEFRLTEADVADASAAGL
jgi:Protein of unknown function (DUF2800)